jgi:hypothetical protein
MWDVMHDAVINDVERGIRRRNRLGIADKNAGSIPILQHTLLCQHDHHWIKIEAADIRYTEGEQNFDASPQPQPISNPRYPYKATCEPINRSVSTFRCAAARTELFISANPSEFNFMVCSSFAYVAMRSRTAVNSCTMPSARSVLAMEAMLFCSLPISARIASIVSGTTIA